MNEVLKLTLPVRDFDRINSFKASIGQRSLNLRDVTLRIKELVETQNEDATVNLRISVGRDRNFNIELIGPTSTYIVRSVLGDVYMKNFGREELLRVFEAYSEHWLSLSKDRDSALNLIKGKMRSMKAIFDF